MCVVKTEALSHWNKSPGKCLQTEDKDKKKKYLDSCLQQHRHFPPLVVSVDGILGMEAEALYKHIAIYLVTKRKQPCLRTCSYVKRRVSITLV